MSRFVRVLAWFLLVVSPACFAAADAPATPGKAAVASAHPLATRAGLEVLEAGGNAFDAAVAVSAALGTVEPHAAGLGGGGFWLLHFAADGRQVLVDGRETAPGAARADMYLDADGEPIPGKSRKGPLAAGIPGFAAALVHLSERYGRLPLAASLAPAIGIAREGFPLYERMRGGIFYRVADLGENPATAERFLDGGEVPPIGRVIRLPGLAVAMERIAREGRRGFYEGETARTLIEAVRQKGGIWTEKDLADYRIVEREPLTARVGRLRIVVPPPPSAGGVALIESLRILEPYPLARMEPVPRAHLVVEALRRAFRDRGYLGDPDFVAMPLARLTDPAYAAGMRSTIRVDRATPSEVFVPLYREAEGTQTTHFSIIDAQGNRVAGTVSLNSWFGSGVLVPGLDILLNNEMDDFTLRPGTSDLFELVGADANTIAPGKRMLSSMTPTFLESERGVAILGTPGGSRIVSMTLLATLAWLEGADARTMVSLPRYHHQYLPDEIVHETEAFTSGQLEQLRRMGHALRDSGRRYGNMEVVTWDYAGNRVEAASDPRAEGVGRVY